MRHGTLLGMVIPFFLGLGCQFLPARPAQNTQSYRAEEVGLSEWVAARPHSPQASGVRVPVDEEVATRFAEALRELALGHIAGAFEIAASVGYEVVEILDGRSRYLALIEINGQGVGPLVVLSTNPTRNLIAEAPHPTFELGTGAQAIELVVSAGARAAILAGAHRCASSTPSGCDGETSVCNKDYAPPSISYVDSDVAHSPSTLFHSAHRTLADLWSDAIVVQLHGMGTGRSRLPTGKTRPPEEWTWFVLSSGANTSVPDSPLSVRARDVLRTLVQEGDVRAVSCQDATDKQRFQHRNLCGTKNVQNRFLLGLPIVCTSGTTEMSPRFLHVEQRFDPVLNDPVEMGIMVKALKDVVPEQAPGQLR